MADAPTHTLTRTGPLDGWAGRFAALPDSVTLLAEPFHTMTAFRPSTTPPEAPAALGLPSAPTAHTWVRGERVDAVWLGPDETLLTSPFLPASALPGTDVSAQRTTLRLRGAHARDVLETGCAVDLHPRSFPPGSAAATLLAQTHVLLLAESPDTYRLLLRPSYAPHLATWLLDAATDHLP